MAQVRDCQKFRQIREINPLQSRVGAPKNIDLSLPFHRQRSNSYYSSCQSRDHIRSIRSNLGDPFSIRSSRRESMLRAPGALQSRTSKIAVGKALTAHPLIPARLSKIPTLFRSILHLHGLTPFKRQPPGARPLCQFRFRPWSRLLDRTPSIVGTVSCGRPSLIYVARRFVEDALSLPRKT